jgi:hypothetical protein
MNHAPAEILANAIYGSSGACLTDPEDVVDWPLYVGSLPEEDGVPNNAAAIFSTAGEVRARYLEDGGYLYKHGFQILVRSLSFPEAWQKAQEVLAYLALLHQEEVTIDDDTYLVDCVMITAPPISTGQQTSSQAMSTKRFELVSINGMIYVH